MAIQKYHLKWAKVLIWISLILFFIGFVFLFSNLGKGYQNEEKGLLETAYIYIITFGLGALTFLIAIWRVRQSEEDVPKPNLTKREQEFFSARRMMMVSAFSYTFYALDGTELASTREDMSKTLRVFRIILSIIYITPILPFTLYLTAGGHHIRIGKQGGFKNTFYVYDQKDRLLAKFESESVMKYRYKIIDGNGEQIATLTSKGSTERFSVDSMNGKSLLSIQIGGIPREAMELFGNIEGDIIDIEREHLDDQRFLQILAAPIIVKLTTRR